MEQHATLSGRMSGLYESSKWHDIEFHLLDSGTGLPVVLRAHRLIVATGSDVFEALCFGPLAEKTKVVVSDIEPQAFDLMLRYFYTDQLELTSAEIASHVLFAAQKYQVTSLIKMSANYLVAHMSDSNCVEIYNLASGLDETIVTRRSLEYICRRLSYVKEFMNRDNLTPGLLRALVTSEQLNCDELTLVKLAELWAKDNCSSIGLPPTPDNIRNILIQNKIFQNIRWSVMSVKDFQQQNILSEEEFLAKPSEFEAPAQRSYFPMRTSVVYMPPSHRHRRDIMKGTCLTTSLTVNTSVVLRSVWLLAKSPLCENVPLVAASRMMQSYVERLLITIKCDGQTIYSQNVDQSVAYNHPYQLPIQNKTVVLNQDKTYTIELKVLANREKSSFHKFYPKSIRNPLGLSVTCEKFTASDQPAVTSFSFITGYVFSI